jgi:hypothetical protein
VGVVAGRRIAGDRRMLAPLIAGGTFPNVSARSRTSAGTLDV